MAEEPGGHGAHKKKHKKHKKKHKKRHHREEAGPDPAAALPKPQLKLKIKLGGQILGTKRSAGAGLPGRAGPRQRLSCPGRTPLPCRLQTPPSSWPVAGRAIRPGRRCGRASGRLRVGHPGDPPGLS